MDLTVVIIIIVAIIAIIIVGVIVKHKKAESRKQELAGWAFSKGLNFNAGRDGSIASYSFKCLQRGDNRYGYNIVEGNLGGRPVRAFDYHYETHHTDSKGNRRTTHHYFSAVIVDANLWLKPLFIRSERLFDKLTEFIGFDDIDFESAEFSKKFYVKSPDKKWAYDVLNQATMEFMLQSLQYDIEFFGRHVIAYRNKTFTVGYFEEAINLVNGILDRLPESLIQELKGK
ncbi:MAG: hypothetical protein WC562_05240 [Dehalococcoidia bacterium]|jgi:hypothetical protein